MLDLGIIFIQKLGWMNFVYRKSKGTLSSGRERITSRYTNRRHLKPEDVSFESSERNRSKRSTYQNFNQDKYNQSLDSNNELTSKFLFLFHLFLDRKINSRSRRASPMSKSKRRKGAGKSNVCIISHR